MGNDYIVQRRIKHQKLRRKARRGEIMVRRVYKFIRFIFVLFIFYVLYRLCAAHFWYLPQDIYTNPKTTGIEIMGNSIVSKDKIISQMKQIPIEHKQIFKINPAEITRKIEELQPVKRAYIRRFWLPARLVVMVEEVKPALLIAPAEDAPDVAAFAITGELITREYLPLNTKNNAVKILSYGTGGDDYKDWDSEKIELLYKLSKLIKKYSGENVLYIDLRQPHNVFVQIQSVKIRLGELDESVFERIKSIKSIIPELKLINENIKYVDLSWKESKYLKLDK